MQESYNYEILLKLSQVENLGFFEKEFKIYLGGYGIDPDNFGKYYDVAEGVTLHDIKDLAFRTLKRRIKMISAHMRRPEIEEAFTQKAMFFTHPGYRYFVFSNYKIDFSKVNFDKLVTVGNGKDGKDYSLLDEAYDRACASKSYNHKAIEKLFKGRCLPFSKGIYSKSGYLKFYYFMDQLEKEIMGISTKNFKYRYSQAIKSSDPNALKELEREALNDAIHRSAVITVRPDGSGEELFTQFATYFLLDILARNDYNLNLESDQVSFIEELRVFWRDNELPAAQAVAQANLGKVSSYGENARSRARMTYSKISPKLRVLGKVFPKCAIPKRSSIKNVLLFDKMFGDDPIYLEEGNKIENV